MSLCLEMGVKLSRETARKEKPAHRSAPSQTQTKLLCGMLFSLPAFLVPFCLTNLQALVSQEAFTTLQVDWSPLQGSHPPLGSSSITLYVPVLSLCIHPCPHWPEKQKRSGSPTCPRAQPRAGYTVGTLNVSGMSRQLLEHPSLDEQINRRGRKGRQNQ